MLDPYRMIVVSGISSLLLLFGLIFYKYRYPKNKINLFILLILISFLPVISIFRTGAYESGDFTLHIYRVIDFYRSLSEGNIFPSWAGNLNALYGYPLFIFINPLPYYIVSFLHLLGFSFIISMKLFLAVSFMLSGIFMYLWTKELFKNELAAFTAGIFYLFTPYHLVDLHFRATVGELTVFMTLPLLLLFITKLINKPSLPGVFATAIAIGLLILSHQAVAVFSFVFVILFTIFYFVLKKTDISKMGHIVLAFLLGGLLAAPALIPYLTYSQFVIKGNFGFFFPEPQELLYSPWRFGMLFQGPKGELSMLLGYTQIVIICGSLYLFFKRKKNQTSFRHHQIFWISLLFFCIFLMNPLSRFLWENIPLIKLAIMSTRLLLLYTLCVSVLAALFVIAIKKNKVIVYLLIAITIAYTILNWGHRRVIPEIDDTVLTIQLPMTTFTIEGWAAGVPIQQKTIHWEKDIPKTPIEITEGNGTIKEISRTSTQHTYIVFAETPVSFRENTWYFPGWNVFINKQQIPVSTLENTDDGYINFSVEKGLHEVVVEYHDLQFLQKAKQFSFFLWIIILLFFIKQLLFVLRKRFF